MFYSNEYLACLSSEAEGLTCTASEVEKISTNINTAINDLDNKITEKEVVDIHIIYIYSQYILG